MPDVAHELVGESGFPVDGRARDRLLQEKGVSNTVFKVSPPHSGCSAEVSWRPCFHDAARRRVLRGFRLHIASVAGDFDEGDSAFLVRGA